MQPVGDTPGGCPPEKPKVVKKKKKKGLWLYEAKM